MPLLDVVQWVICALSIAGAGLTCQRPPLCRFVGFWLYLASNLLNVGWSYATGNTGFLVMQLAFTVFSVWGLHSNRRRA